MKFKIGDIVKMVSKHKESGYDFMGKGNGTLRLGMLKGKGIPLKSKIIKIYEEYPFPYLLKNGLWVDDDCIELISN